MPSHVAHVVSNNLGPAWLPGQGCQRSQESSGSCHLGLFRVLHLTEATGYVWAPHPNGPLQDRETRGRFPSLYTQRPLRDLLWQQALTFKVTVPRGGPALNSEVGSASFPDSPAIKTGNSLGTCRTRLQPHSPWLLPRLVPRLWPTTQLQECPMAWQAKSHRYSLPAPPISPEHNQRAVEI